MSSTFLSPQISLTFSPSKPSFFTKSTDGNCPQYICLSSTSSSSSIKMSSETIEHIVLIKTKDDTDPNKVSTMLNNLNGLKALKQVAHLTAGPIHKNRSTAFSFTHMLHSRYKSKLELREYADHPSHLSVVKESVLPISDDLIAVDWVNSNVNTPSVPAEGSVMRITLMKLKEGLGDKEMDEILEVGKRVRTYFPAIVQSSSGKNFSPGRAKGFSVASIVVYPGLSELEAADSANLEMVAAEKAKARHYLDGVIVVDYVIPSSS